MYKVTLTSATCPEGTTHIQPTTISCTRLHLQARRVPKAQRTSNRRRYHVQGYTYKRDVSRRHNAHPTDDDIMYKVALTSATCPEGTTHIQPTTTSCTRLYLQARRVPKAQRTSNRRRHHAQGCTYKRDVSRRHNAHPTDDDIMHKVVLTS